ncbi:MAG: TrbI/VirB10 family protein [Rhodospirillaceae bacterium]|nr:TrbI/VirB10 family protein [Rhodospirillaceae bacterium]
MADQTYTPPPKENPERLSLRAAPRRAIRFKRNLLIGVAGVVSLVLFGVVGMGLKPPALRSGSNGQELYNVDRKAMADQVAALPATYGQMQKPDVPALGPPLPGDLGGPILEQERALGIYEGDGGFGHDAEADDARAERIRLAQQARRAKEASVFFPLTTNQNTQAMTQAGQGNGTAMPAASPGAEYLNLDPERDQNNQQRKIDFMNRPGGQSIYNAYPLQDAVSPYQVMAGSIIAASLITGINSDLPGMVAAQITENIYDTVSGRFLLIPQGARLIGSYDSVVAFGQSRALLVWQSIIMPDGSSIQIENLPATDVAGYAGLADEVDFHTWRLLKGVVLSTLLGVGTELSLGSDESDLVRAIRESTQQNVNRAGQRITERNLNIQPTITVRPGWPLRVIVHKDLILRPYRG